MKSSISETIQPSNNKGSAYDVYEIQYDVKLAANIIRTRLELKKTQEDIAKILKTSQSAIARAESGNQPTSHKLLKKLARAFEAKLTPPDFILTKNIQSITLDEYVSGKTESQSSGVFFKTSFPTTPQQTFQPINTL
jgi:transcriptional regulator with XRE-family HTH domain